MSESNLFGPVESKELAGRMRAIALTIDEFLNGEQPSDKPKQWGFVLLCFQFGPEGHRMNYMSNADRADVIAALREQLAIWEGTAGADEST